MSESAPRTEPAVNTEIGGMQHYYAKRAPIYDEIYALPERQADLRWLEQFIPRQLQGRCVIEVAAGTGYWTQFIAHEATSVFAVDLNPETLALLASRNLGAHVTTAVCDAYSVAETGSYNAGFAGFWFSHVPLARRRSFLQNLESTLAPGSPVVLIDNQYDAKRHALDDVDAAGNGWQSRTLPDGSTHRVLKNFPRPDELLEAIDGIGTSPIWRELEHFWVFQYTTGACRA